MTAGSVEAPVLVLAVGNLLLQDDAVGLRLLEELSARDFGDDVEFVDGGTQGLSLLGRLAHREALVILDAVSLGDAPGTIHILRGEEVDALRARRSSTSHESNAIELLAYARLLGYQPPEVIVVGIEPEIIATGIGLSANTRKALPGALAGASAVIESARRKSVCA